MPEENLEQPSGNPLFSDGPQNISKSDGPAEAEVETADVLSSIESVEQHADGDDSEAGEFDETIESDIESGDLTETAETEKAPTQPSADESEAGVVTEEMVREKLKGLPGRWYVLHTYAGYEKRVKHDLETRIHSMDMEDYIFQVEVPMEEVFEVKKGQRKLVSRVRIPGYALVRMKLTDDSWRVVQDTNGVTGFVGNGRNPVALTPDEVVQMLTPVVEQEAAAAADAAGAKPGTGGLSLQVEYEVGETVTLTTEPWVGMPATISQVDAVNQRLTVLMTLVGQETPVDLSFSQIKKMD